jgi:hypothetical protein
MSDTTSIALAITQEPQVNNFKVIIARVEQECGVKISEDVIKKTRVLILSGPSSKISRAKKQLQRAIVEIGGMLQLR